MPSNLAFMLDFATLLPGAVSADPSDFTQIVNYPYELDADGHWLFGGGAASLVARHGPNPDSLPSLSAGATPSYGDSYIDIAPYPGGLVTDWNDADNPVMSVAWVQARPVDTQNYNQIAYSTSPSNHAYGGLVYWTDGYDGSNNPVAVTLGTRATDMSNTTLSGAPGAVAIGNYCFIGLSFSATERTLFMPGLSALISSGTRTLTGSSAKIGLGNRYYNSAAYTTIGMRAAEFIVWKGKAKTAAEFAAIAERSAIRLAERSITLVSAA